MIQFRSHIALEGPTIGAGGHRMGCPIMSSVEEFISPRIQSRWVHRSLYLQLQISGRKNQNRIDIVLFIKKSNWNRIKMKNTIVTSLWTITPNI